MSSDKLCDQCRSPHKVIPVVASLLRTEGIRVYTQTAAANLCEKCRRRITVCMPHWETTSVRLDDGPAIARRAGGA